MCVFIYSSIKRDIPKNLGLLYFIVICTLFNSSLLNVMIRYKKKTFQSNEGVIFRKIPMKKIFFSKQLLRIKKRKKKMY